MLYTYLFIYLYSLRKVLISLALSPPLLLTKCYTSVSSMIWSPFATSGALGNSPLLGRGESNSGRASAIAPCSSAGNIVLQTAFKIALRVPWFPLCTLLSSCWKIAVREESCCCVLWSCNKLCCCTVVISEISSSWEKGPGQGSPEGQKRLQK